MRALFWILGLFALAVGLVVAARYNSGYVLIVLSQHRVELSANFAVALLISAFAAVYLLVRTMAAALRLPTEVREYHVARRRERGDAALMESLQAYFEGRFGKAERAAEIALNLGHAPAIAAVVAARSAHEMRSFDARDRYLARLENIEDPPDYLRRITQAGLLLDERRYLDALAVLEKIRDKHTGALRLELKAHQFARNWDRVEALLPQLERRNVYDPVALAQVRRTTTAEVLRRRAGDRPRLEEAWDRVAPDLKLDSLVARAAAESFLQAADPTQAHRIVSDSLDKHWDSQLVTLYSEGTGVDPLERIQKAEAWLPAHPRDASLLLTLGRLCSQASLWGKAKSYFEASLGVESSHSTHLELARLARSTGQVEDAGRHSEAALRLAVAQLEEVTGGRRRRPL